MNIFRLTLIAFSLVILVNCGGGGGSGTPTTMTPNNPNNPDPTLERLPVFAVANAENARSLVGGTETTSMTPAQIYQNIKSRADSADVLQLSDLHVVVVTDSGAVDTDPSTVTCDGVACMFSLATGIPVTQFSLNDVDSYPLFGDTDLSRFNVDSEVVMEHNGVIMVQGRGAAVAIDEQDDSETRLDYHSYGGWLTSSVFGAESFAVTPDSGAPVVWYGGYSFGDNSGSNPQSGTATWMGAMVGTTQSGQVIHGSVEIDIDDFNNPDLDIEFNMIRNLDSRAIVTSMGWANLDLTGGKFSHEHALTGSIEGTFYGTTHDEIGGIFDRDDIVGAFGAAR